MEAAAFAEEFLHLMKADRFQDYEARLRFLEEKHGRSEATEERKKRFLRVASFIEQHLNELNHGMAVIAGKDAVAVSSGLVFAVYARLYLSRDGGAGATPREVLDYFASLEKSAKG